MSRRLTVATAVVWLVSMFFFVALAFANDGYLYPFHGYALGQPYEVFLSYEGAKDMDVVSTVLQDDERCWISLPRSNWQGMEGELQAIYDRKTGLLYDVRYVIYVAPFDVVVRKLSSLYPSIDSFSYTSMDAFFRNRPDWLSMMSSRLDRRIKEDQLALFVTDSYRIEVWDESFSAEQPTVVVLYRAIE